MDSGRGGGARRQEAAVLEVIQGGQKAMSMEQETTVPQTDTRRTQANRDRRQARKRKLTAEREGNGRDTDPRLQAAVERVREAPKVRGKENRRTSRVWNCASAGRRAKAIALRCRPGETVKGL